MSGLADHDQEAYLDCPLHNPERFDSKLRRQAGSKRNDEIRLLLLHHLDLVITQLEGAMGIKLTDQAVESMLLDFIKRAGWEYKAISLYNLHLGFAYMTEAKDLFGCRVTDTNMALQIKSKSEGFETTSNGLIFRRRDVKGTKLRLYFNNHQIDNGHPAKESVNVEIVELKGATLKPKTIFTKTISFSGTLFFNMLMRWERLRVIASDHL
ncbi:MULTISPECIES: hypothetical protein [Pseudomonas]|uniref:hypothetical protein n=1 Tax=Pseudomonas TaxID=286 RepID=UPI000368B8D9|nr:MULTISPECIES: hypothetical protein [Pseudomonas]